MEARALRTGRPRRVDGWGFVGESFPPPAPMLNWLVERVGPAEPQTSAAPAASASLPGPRALPPLPVAISQEPLDRLQHSRGRGLPDLLRLRSGVLPAAPDAVVRPADAGEVEAVLAVCSREGIRVIPWGGGSSVTGGVNTLPDPAPAVVLDLERLAGLRRLDEISGLATFGAGTFGPALEEALAARGLTLGHFPQSFELSTVGGWAATRSSGQESLGFGRIEDMVAGLELVAPAGRLSLPPMPASAAGPDLRQLALGSEGRLGVITEVTVRVRPRPAERRVEALLLPSWEEGTEAVRELVLSGLPLGLMRLSDPPETAVALAVGLGGHAWGRIARRWLSARGLTEQSCLLLCGAVGKGARLVRALAAAREILKRRGAVSLGERPGRKWVADRFRHPYLRDGLLDQGVGTDTFETAAPWSTLPALYRTVRSALAGEEVPVLCHLSHVYRDGASLYFTFFYRCPRDVEAAVARWAELKRAATLALLGAGGTLSHHHGVGSWHAPWYAREVGERGVRVVAAAAKSLDPRGVMNPHVLLDPADRLEA